jgi:hypothetical protein
MELMYQELIGMLGLNFPSFQLSGRKIPQIKSNNEIGATFDSGS